MSNSIIIPLTREINDELEDAFIDEKEDAHKFIWTLIRTLCRDAKMGKLNKSCVFQKINEKNEMVKDSIKLKEVTLEEVPSDPNWLPKDLDTEDVAKFEHKITDKTMEYLKLFASFALLRHDKFSESQNELDEKNYARLLEQLEKEKDPDKQSELNSSIEDFQKKMEENKAEREKNRPKCLEEIIYNSIYGEVYRRITANIDKALDKENEEMYPEKKDEKESKPKAR